MNQAPTAHVLLVHGTWAPDATWVNQDSPLASRISTEFAELRIAAPMRWSGANSFRARQQAAEALVARLRSESGTVRFILIAHSHGGSVLHYAYRIAPDLFAEKVLGAACMATPFFGFSLRPGYGSLVMAAVVVTAILLLHAGMAAIMFGSEHLKWNLEDNLPRLMAVGSIFAATLLTVTIMILRNRQGLHDWLAAGADALSKWETAVIRLPEVAFFRSMGDEVALGLSTGQFLSTIINRLLGSLSAAAERVMGFLGWMNRYLLGKAMLALLFVLMTIAAGLPPAIQGSLGFRSEDFIMLFWIYGVGCGIDEAPAVGSLLCAGLQLALWVDLGLVALTMLLLVFAVLGWACNFFMLRLFGTWSLRAAVSAEFAIEPVPEGAHRFCNTGWSRDPAVLARERPTLQHSEPYSSHSSRSALCDWIRTLLSRNESG
jgi:pimeloyl-ACP methyl ester carboxylesterase